MMHAHASGHGDLCVAQEGLEEEVELMIGELM
jgi:hypothetical protein